MRTSRLFRQLAWRGLRANRDVFMPYLAALTLVVALFNMLASLVDNAYVRSNGASLVTLLGLGAVVIGLFSAAFVTYARRFLDGRRVRELAVYSVLGLEKRQIALVLLWETLWVAGAALLGGLVLAALFGNLAFMALNALMRLPVQLGYVFSWPVTLITVGLFGGLSLLLWAWQVARLSLSTPVGQLTAQRAGERDPKANLLTLLVGVAALGAGYGLALTTKNPVAALQTIFLAIVLVIVGTYSLFTAGSIFVLRALRANRRFYYRPQAFIATSGMLYRMRQNAAGLANIAVLLTMIVVTLATTATIFIGSEATLRERYPHQNELVITATLGGKNAPVSLAARRAALQDAQARVQRLTEQAGRRVTKEVRTHQVSLLGTLQGTRFRPSAPTDLSRELPQLLTLITADAFNAHTGAAVQVPAGQVLALAQPEPYPLTTLVLGPLKVPVRPLSVGKVPPGSLAGLVEPLITTVVLIVPDEAALARLTQAGIDAGGTGKSITESLSYGWETDAATPEARLTYARSVRAARVLGGLDGQAQTEGSYQSRSLAAQDFYTLNGGLLFIGAFMGLVFSVGAVLITYFKQVSEGQSDRERYRIMTQVGLDGDTIRRTTNMQLVWMFFLPLGVAVIHTCFAFPMISRMLVLFGITDAQPFFISMLVVVVVVGLLYFVVYRLTSVMYLKIVQGLPGRAGL